MPCNQMKFGFHIYITSAVPWRNDVIQTKKLVPCPVDTHICASCNVCLDIAQML